MLLAVACRDHERGARQRNAPVPGATLVLAVTAAPRSLLPPFASDLVSGQLCDLVYQRLAEPRPGFSPHGDAGYRPALARAWTWSADSLQLRFTIDTAARWHDGVPVTSADVAFTFALLRDPSVGAHRSGPSRVVDSVTVADRQTVVVWANRRTPNLFHDVVYGMHVLPAHRYAAVARSALATVAARELPVGSGPFRVVERQTDRVLLERVGATPNDAIARLVVRLFPGYDSALLALLAGEVHLIDFVRPSDLPRVRARGPLATLSMPGFGYAALQFNLRAADGAGALHAASSHPVLGDVRVRRALAMAIDRDVLVANVLDGQGTVGTGPIPRGAGGQIPGTMPTFDPAAAERLLDHAGWVRSDAGAVRQRAGRPLEIAVLVPASTATRVRTAVLVQSMLARVGVRVTIERLDHAAMVDALERGRFDAALTAYRVDPDPTSVASDWTTRHGQRSSGFNYGGYASSRTDTLLALAGRASGPAADRAYAAAVASIVGDVPAVFLYEPVATVVHPRTWRPIGLRGDAWWASLPEWRLAPAVTER